ncbi:COG3650 family protein [Paracoccus sp. SCSIO 75233]|uniref:COG3650 family protein n=1 Tax=Paracoccus sp. SCSIO 75233 TaxID=3017782 RepID=UPI0022F110D1|nr:SH3 domain-containing protein [Paracoccus sp. SCSIO 75233]WBU53258.1 SH3 domain-containing protein [Paracoccus sp. SCSIO 75233]
MFRWVFLAAMLLATPVSATQEYVLPTLFDVSGVAADDVLNIRARPTTRSEVIGTLAPDATGIEIVATEGNWGRVNLAERSGWVSMHFLRYRTDVWESGSLPAGFTCGGTEPFWSLDPEGGGMRWSTPEGDRIFERLTVLDSGVLRSPRRALLAQDAAGTVSATVTPKQCSDGMSDRVYGLEATVIFQDDPVRLYSGCCQITAPR